MTKEFEFVDEGRKFFCSVETPRHAGAPPWWWFRLDHEGSTRYAPFEALPSDTRKSVQARVIAYYTEILAIKARPVHQRPFWQKPAPAAKPEEIAAVAATATAAATSEV
ncbi:MAG: hypothetical protein M3Q09_11335 [Gemmatimonadota bacterium]|nr:hypothetical protein [Gemmatimonadota bacterium]